MFTLITGADSSIGNAVARRIASGGLVILQGSRFESLEALRLDLPNCQTHLIWLQELAQTTDSLTGLLSASSAVVSDFVHCAEEVAQDANPVMMRRLFQVNYFSATAILRLLLKKSVNRGALRSVVFLSSIASRFGAKGTAAYAATKGALDSLSRSLAAELAPSVRVNSILRGDIEKSCDAGYLLGPGTADDVAAMAEYLTSDRARWITGQQFVIDGGKTAH